MRARVAGPGRGARKIATAMRTCLSTAFVALLALTGGCGNDQTGPTSPLNTQFTLAPQQSMSVDGTPLTVAFLNVTGDSRCPGDAICIQGGDAIVHVRATAATTSEYELHTGDAARSAVTHAGYRIALTKVEPYPFSSLPAIQPGDYRATLVVTR